MAEPSTARAVFRRGWRGIRPRLIGVLLVPTIAALVFGGMRMQVAVAESAEAARAESIAAALPDSFRLAVQLTIERDAAGAGLDPEADQAVEDRTDAAAAAWRAHLPRIDDSEDPALRADLRAAVEALDDLAGLRQELEDPLSRPDARRQYTRTLNLLLGLSAHLPSLDDEALYQQADALAQVRAASESLGVLRSVVAQALADGAVSESDLVDLTRARGVWEASTELFAERTSPAAARDFAAISDSEAGLALIGAVETLATTGRVKALDITLAEWQAISVQFVQRMEEVIVRAADDLADDVAATRSSAEQAAVVTAVVIFLVLFTALGAATLAARSILRPLGRLRQAALEIAQDQLPRRVRAIAEADGPVDVTVAPLEIGSQDEIGEVADAFGAVHAEALRLAGEQAEMRANVDRMFVNLARRSKNLVERQLRLIDDLEASEQDPDDLANLFRLDHLATRMRRNDESLLVLAGGDAGQGVRDDVPVVDVLRAAASEIEQYARVQVTSDDPRRIRGRVAGDLVHLLAELIENAANFSPPDTTVTVRTTRQGADGVLSVEIADLGVGMTADELARANEKLRRTDRLDADVARMMGLVVTARLARRHGLAVELGPNTPRGVVARVHVPAGALAGSLPALAPQAQPLRTEDRVITWFAKVGTGHARTTTTTVTGPVKPTEPTRVVPLRNPLEPSALDLPATIGHDEDDSPIFASLQSEWFTRRTPLSARHRSPESSRTTPAATGGWTSPADAGWRRAAEVSTRGTVATTTPTGLPKRVPGQHLVPGSAPDTPAPAASRPVDPRRARGLSSFQQGVNRARETDGRQQ